MSGECNICGVMGCVESNHKETNVSDAKPYRVECLDHDSWSIVRDGKMSLCSIRTKTQADEICAALNDAAASRDGEVGRHKAALERIETGDLYENSPAHEAEMVDEARRIARSALAPGNGGEKKPQCPVCGSTSHDYAGHTTNHD